MSRGCLVAWAPRVMPPIGVELVFWAGAVRQLLRDEPEVVG